MTNFARSLAGPPAKKRGLPATARSGPKLKRKSAVPLMAAMICMMRSVVIADSSCSGGVLCDLLKSARVMRVQSRGALDADPARAAMYSRAARAVAVRTRVSLSEAGRTSSR